MSVSSIDMALCRKINSTMNNSLNFPLESIHLISESQTRSLVANIKIMFFYQWSMFDKILIANDDYINRIRNGEIIPYEHRINGQLIAQDQADLISEGFGEQYREQVEEARKNWEFHFEKSQNYLRITHLANTYLYWEENAREQLLHLVNFEHDDIVIEKKNATIRANTFGDLAKIRNSFWHSRSGKIGICNYRNSEFKELTQFMTLEKDTVMEIGASELPRMGHHIFKRLSEFPNGYLLGVDNR